MKEVVINLFDGAKVSNGYLWLGDKVLSEMGFKEGTRYFQTWDASGKLICDVNEAEAVPGDGTMIRRATVNQHKKGPVIRAEGKMVANTFAGFKSVKAKIEPGRIVFTGYKRPDAIEVLPNPGVVANALAGR